MKIRLDHGGIASVLKGENVARQVHRAATRRASSVRSHPSVAEHVGSESVKVEDYETDRAASAVVILHPAGMPIQAKYGVLTKGE